MPCTTGHRGGKCRLMTTNAMLLRLETRLRFPSYKLGNTSLEWVEETKYLGVTIQTNLKFDKHIEHKTRLTSRALGMVKFTLYTAPRQGHLWLTPVYVARY